MKILKNFLLANNNLSFSKDQIFKIGELLFFCAMTTAYIDYILFDCTTFSIIMPNILGKLLTIIIYLFLIVKIVLFTSYSKRELITIFFIFILIILSLVSSKNLLLFKAFLFLIGCKDMPIRKIFVTIRKWIILLLILTIICNVSGIIESYDILRTHSDFMRYSLGFNHPNMLAMYILQLLLISLYLDYDHLNIKFIVIYTVVLLSTYIITASRTTCMLGLFCFILSLFFHHLDSIKKQINHLYFKITKNNLNDYINQFLHKRAVTNIYCIIKKCFIFLPEILGFGSLLLGMNYNSTLSTLNELFSGRILYINVFLNQYGIHLFGSYVPYSCNYVNNKGEIIPLILDNVYANIAIRFGILLLIVVLVSYTLLLKKMIIEKDTISLLIISTYLIFGLMESHFLYITANFSLFFLSRLVFDSNTINDNGKIYSLLKG